MPHMSLVHSFSVEGYPKSQQILLVPCMFLMLPCMAFCGAAWWGLQLQWFGVRAVHCVAGGNWQEDFQAYCSLGQGQIKADLARIINFLTQQARALQKHTRLVRTQERIGGQCTAVGNALHHAEYSNKSCATNQTANLFLVVLGSYEHESPCSDFSLMSCDGKSVAHEKNTWSTDDPLLQEHLFCSKQGQPIHPYSHGNQKWDMLSQKLKLIHHASIHPVHFGEFSFSPWIQLNSIARIQIWKDIHAKDVCRIMCLISTWTCKNKFQSDLELFFLELRSRGLGAFLAGKTRFFHVSLQIAPWQGFHNINPVICIPNSQSMRGLEYQIGGFYGETDARGGSCRPSPWLLAQGRWKREPRSILSNARCISSFPGLKFSWNAKTIKEWSVYIPAHKPTLRLRWSMDSPYSVQTISKRWSFPGLFLPQLNSIARIRIWKDIHSKDVCRIVCLIWTWTCKNYFQAFWVIFLEWKKSRPWCFFGRKNPVLPCRSANSTVARFSQYQPCNLHSEFPINARSWVPNWWILWGDGPSGGFVQTIAMASCPGSVEARAQIYLEQCPLHLKFSWSQVFLERKDDQRMISLHSRAQTSFDGLWTVRILFRQSAKDEAFQDFSCHGWIPLPVFEFESTFIQKMFVELCAWFGPEHAKTIFKHFELFFSNERSRGLGVFLAGKTGSSM